MTRTEYPQPVGNSHIQRVRIVIRGAVQGVGFRPFIFRLAEEMGLKGWVINNTQGVFIEAEAQPKSFRRFYYGSAAKSRRSRSSRASNTATSTPSATRSLKSVRVPTGRRRR